MSLNEPGCSLQSRKGPGGIIKCTRLYSRCRHRVLPSGRSQAATSLSPICAEPSNLVTWKATGVPVFDKLASIGPGTAANMTALQIISACLLCTFGLKLISDRLSRGSLPIEDEGKSEFRPLLSISASITPVVSRMVPLISYFYCLTVGMSLLSLYEVNLRQSLLNTVLNEALVVQTIHLTAQFFQDTVDVIFIISITWFVKNIKNRVCSYITNRSLRDSSEGLKRMLFAGSHAVDYILYLGAFLSSLKAFGFDINPLLASLGASSVVIGIATREIIENIAAAITLYTAPPFEAGDNIKLYSVEGLESVQVIAEGTVKSIEPLRTIIETARGTTIYVANSMVLKFMVENESQNPKDVS